MTLVAALAIFVSALAADQSALPLLPGIGSRPDPVLEEATRKLDPAVDGWDSEVFATETEAQFEALVALLLDPHRITSASVRDLVAPGYRGSRLRPLGLRPVYQDASITVLRSDEEGAASGTFRLTNGLVRSLRELSVPLVGTTGTRIEFKFLDISAEPGSEKTVTYLHAAGRLPDGAVELNAVWHTRWVRKGDGVSPRISSIRVEQYEEVASHPPRGTFFVDVTEAVLAHEPEVTEQLRHGVDHWLERMEAWIETDGFGHHGIAVGDVNGDGLDDIYLPQMAGLPNRLLLQRPDGTLRDVGAEAGVDWLDRSRSALIIDLDNDGDQDLVVSTNYAVLFMENTGSSGGTVSFVARASLPVESDIVSMAAADYDDNGNLDIYACTYHSRHGDVGRFAIPIPYHDANNGGGNILFHNNGRWSFRDVTRQTRLDENNRRFSLAASWEDYDNDGDQDLYVANDFGRNNLYRNDGGRFTDVAAESGAEDIAAGMSADWADYDHDGWMDLYVGNMFSSAGRRIASQDQFRGGEDSDRDIFLRHARGNSLFRNRGNGEFDDVSVDAAVTMGRWAWGSKFVDLDNNGWEDLVVANGYFTRDDPDDL